MVDRLISYQLGLFGHPVKHSQSPSIHAAFARQFGMHIDYQLVDVTTEQLPTVFREFMTTAHGCNVTVPHKQDVMPLLDHYTEKAQRCQAVNTVYWRDEKLWGDNTDGDGLVLDLISKGVPLTGAQILILGAGGATQGIIPSLIEHGVDHIDIKNRHFQKAKKLADQFDFCTAIGPKNLTANNYNLIIHATSMGYSGQTPELQASWFGHETIAYDLSYGKAAAPFVAAAKAQGARQVYDGLGMLYGQAALAFEVWFGERPVIHLP